MIGRVNFLERDDGRIGQILLFNESVIILFGSHQPSRLFENDLIFLDKETALYSRTERYTTNTYFFEMLRCTISMPMVHNILRASKKNCPSREENQQSSKGVIKDLLQNHDGRPHSLTVIKYALTGGLYHTLLKF